MRHPVALFGHEVSHVTKSISKCFTKALQTEHPVVQALLAYGAAIATYQLCLQYSPNGNALAALAGTSALLMAAFAIESTKLSIIVLNLLALPFVFTHAYLSLGGTESLLMIAFAIQTLVIAIQLKSADSSLKRELRCLAIFNASMVLLLL